jgi:hypothetical protein
MQGHDGRRASVIKQLSFFDFVIREAYLPARNKADKFILS